MMKKHGWRGWVVEAVTLSLTLMVMAGCSPARREASPAPPPLPPLPEQPPRYVAQKLPSPGNLTLFSGMILNDEGQVIGTGPLKGVSKRFELLFDAVRVAIWDDERFHVIPDTTGLFPVAFNSRGQAALQPFGFVIGTRLWSDGTLTPIPRFLCRDINNRGQVVGKALPEGGLHFVPSLWSEGKLSDMSFGLQEIKPHSINDRGQIVAITYPREASDPPADKHQDIVYLLNPGSRRWEPTHLLNDLPVPLKLGSVEKLEINNRGQIVISLSLEIEKRTVFRAAIWDQGRIQAIGGRERQVTAEAMNDRGQIVGRASFEKHEEWRPFLWQGGRLYDLNRLLVDPWKLKLTDALSINNKGWILCKGRIGDQSYDFILRPADPESGPVLLAAHSSP